MAIYAKANQENLTNEQLKQFKDFIKSLENLQ
jgi:hypothetical protein